MSRRWGSFTSCLYSCRRLCSCFIPLRTPTAAKAPEKHTRTSTFGVIFPLCHDLIHERNSVNWQIYFTKWSGWFLHKSRFSVNNNLKFSHFLTKKHQKTKNIAQKTYKLWTYELDHFEATVHIVIAFNFIFCVPVLCWGWVNNDRIIVWSIPKLHWENSFFEAVLKRKNNFASV